MMKHSWHFIPSEGPKGAYHCPDCDGWDYIGDGPMYSEDDCDEEQARRVMES